MSPIQTPARALRPPHVAEIFWIAAMASLFAGAAYGPLVALLTLPPLASALGWGFRAAMAATACTVLALLSIAAGLDDPLLFYAGGALDIRQTPFIPAAAYLAILGLLLGYLGEHRKQLRAEVIAAARLARQSHQASTPGDTFRVIFAELFDAFRPLEVQLAVHDVPAGRTHVWESRGATSDGSPSVICREPDLSRREELLLEYPGCYIVASPAASVHGGVNVQAFDSNGTKVDGFQDAAGRDWFPARFRSLISVPIAFGIEWQVRLFLWDPLEGKVNRSALRDVIRVVNRLDSTIFAAALQQQLRSRGMMEERARAARELHDGIVQSLAALDLRVEVVRRVCERESYSVLDEVASIQRVLRAELCGMRELIRHERRLDMTPGQLLSFVSETVRRFEMESGIKARFIAELDDVHLPARVCYELAKIVQEALTNVRKHSKAAQVIVRFARHAGKCVLVITDDGRGFDFAGRYSLSDLEAARKGPVIIKERLRSIGGDMTIESAPERGSRIEILVAGQEEGERGSRLSPV